MMKQRSMLYDNMKGILIFLVVFAHCLWQSQEEAGINLIVDGIYYFHMPAFVFVSGFFSKSENSRSRYSLLKLLVAYVLIMVPFIMLDAFRGEAPHILKTYYSAWYLMALIIWRVLTPYLAKFKYIMPGIIVFSVLVGFWNDFGGTGILAINKVVTFYPYFMAGYLMQKNTVERIRDNRAGSICGGLICLVLVPIIEYVATPLLDITNRDLLPNNYGEIGLSDPMGRMAIMIVSVLFILAMICLTPNRKIPLLTTAGRNSLSIYLIHRPFTLVFTKVFGDCSQTMQISMALISALAIVVLFGSNYISSLVDKIIETFAKILDHQELETKSATAVIKTLMLLVFLFIMITPVISEMCS